MPIQIVSLREVQYKGLKKLSDKQHMKEDWLANNVAELFDNIDHYIDQIPESERWNMFYTVNSIEQGDRKKFIEQTVIPIDIDKIGSDHVDDYIRLIEKEFELDMSKVGLVSSGNGLHVIIGLAKPITDVKYFDAHKSYYKALCYRLNDLFFTHGLSGTADATIFNSGRILRLPNTTNIKKGGEKQCTLINGNIEPIDFDLVKESRLPVLAESDHIHPMAMTKLPTPDTKAVLEGCDFLAYCKDNQEKLPEPQWYAMLSILGRLENPAELAHEYSKGHREYSVQETDRKLAQAIENSGPRTCTNVATLFDGCMTCSNWAKCKSPVLIKGEGHLATRGTGFYNVEISKSGKVNRTPNYDDLVEHFKNHGQFVVSEENLIVYRWHKTHWQEELRSRIKAFAEQNFEPKPTEKMAQEFYSKICRNNLKHQDWLDLPNGNINLRNGVYKSESGELVKHSTEFGFTSILNFDYDPYAECPRWIEFIEQVMQGHSSRTAVIQEMMGACIMNIDPQKIQKAFILLGGGANGKSVFLEVLTHMLGTNNVSNTFLKALLTKDEARLQLKDKLVNISDETPSDAFRHDAVFKAITAGATVEGRRLYHGIIKFKVMAKLIMAANSMPEVDDTSYGMYRRFIIIPFKRTFLPQEQDRQLTGKLIEEASGIFNWALIGYHRLVANGYQFSENQEMEQEKLRIMNSDTPIVDFFNVTYEITGNDDDYVVLHDVVEEYSMYDRTAKANTRTVYRQFKAWVCRTLQDPTHDTEVRKIGTKPTRVISKVRVIMEDGNEAPY